MRLTLILVFASGCSLFRLAVDEGVKRIAQLEPDSVCEFVSSGLDSVQEKHRGLYKTLTSEMAKGFCESSVTIGVKYLESNTGPNEYCSGS